MFTFITYEQLSRSISLCPFTLSLFFIFLPNLHASLLLATFYTTLISKNDSCSGLGNSPYWKYRSASWINRLTCIQLRRGVSDRMSRRVRPCKDSVSASISNSDSEEPPSTPSNYQAGIVPAVPVQKGPQDLPIFLGVSPSVSPHSKLSARENEKWRVENEIEDLETLLND